MFYKSKYTFVFSFQSVDSKTTPIKILKNYFSHNNSPLFFKVNDVIGLAITSDFEQSVVSLPQLDEDLSQTNYVDDPADVFMTSGTSLSPREGLVVPDYNDGSKRL